MKTRILRIYMPNAAKVRGKLSFWRKLLGSDLSWYLVKSAKKDGIEQAIAMRSTLGYLKGKKLVSEGAEVTPDDLPVCVELIDEDNKLRSFITRQKSELDGYRVILFDGIELN